MISKERLIRPDKVLLYFWYAQLVIIDEIDAELTYYTEWQGSK
jgi:hypothetical protein